MNKTINQNKTGVEYVLIDDGFGEEEGYFTWLINYDEGEARYKESVSSNDLDFNDIDYKVYKGSIYEYLENNKFEIDDEENTEEYVKFHKRTFIYLSK